MKTLIIVLLGFSAFVSYVLIRNRDKPHLSFRQKLVRTLYPAIRRAGQSPLPQQPPVPVTPPVSFHTLRALSIEGDTLDFSSYRNRYVLLVNTASDCGFTPQYDGLEALRQKCPDLAILGFPSNDFKQQEKGTDEQIASFCRINFGVGFPLVRKSKVTRGEGQHPVFAWLSDPSANGWNKQAPSWNFCKYLIDGEGRLVAVFPPTAEPLKEVYSFIALRYK